MILGNESIGDLFSVFHDGVIFSHRLNGDDLELEINIQYLAERINPEYGKFLLKIHKTNNYSFEKWLKDEKAPPAFLTKPTEIFAHEPDILSGEVKNGLIEVALNQASVDCDYCGGTLSFSADSASVFDQGNKEYSLDELKEISAGYWDEWKRENQRKPRSLFTKIKIWLGWF